MVEQRVLDDYKTGDWIGVHYRDPSTGLFFDFPTIVSEIRDKT